MLTRTLYTHIRFEFSMCMIMKYDIYYNLFYLPSQFISNAPTKIDIRYDLKMEDKQTVERNHWRIKLVCSFGTNVQMDLLLLFHSHADVVFFACNRLAELSNEQFRV